MKKVYKKPTVIIENFLVSEHIASCNMEAANNVNISIDDLRFAGYFTSEEGCLKALAPGYEFEYNGTQLCYHTSVDTGIIFSS